MLTEPLPRKGLKEGRRGGEGGVMNGESSWDKAGWSTSGSTGFGGIRIDGLPLCTAEVGREAVGERFEDGESVSDCCEKLVSVSRMNQVRTHLIRRRISNLPFAREAKETTMRGGRGCCSGTGWGGFGTDASAELVYCLLDDCGHALDTPGGGR